MGEVEISFNGNKVYIHSILFFYGEAANDECSDAIAKDIADYWNAAKGKVLIKNTQYDVLFNIEGMYAKALTPKMVFNNNNPRNNYFRIENFASDNISFVDGVGSNTGYFLLDNLLNNSTTAAHEYGHTIGLHHPAQMDIRGQGTPGIMYPRGSIVDAPFQYSPLAAPNAPGGTINPFTRKVLQQDIDNLNLHRLAYDDSGFATIGKLTNVWHTQHQP